MTKAKGLPTRFARALRIVKWGTVLATIGLCGWLAYMVAYLSIGTIEPAPSPTLLLTAEYLYAHPQPTLEYLPITDKRPGGWGYEICYGDTYLKETDEATIQQLPMSYLKHELFLNGQRVPPRALSFHKFTYITEPPLITYRLYCLNPHELAYSLHLLELHLTSNEGETVYQWAAIHDGGSR